jgi:serine/threonine-protein kinase
MLTGRRLFYGETDYQTVELVRQCRIPAIRPLNTDVDADLEAVVRKGLARDPRDRFQQAADLQDALAQLLFSRGMKVTSRDIANIVRQVVSERDAAKTKSSGPHKSIIDALIQEEILKFTSLDALGQSSPPVGLQTLSPEPVSNGQSPLDPGSFIDTRGWADDLESRPPVEVSEPPPVKAEPPPPSVTTTGQMARPEARRSKRFTVPPTPPPEVQGLEEILEPERPVAIVGNDKTEKTTTDDPVVAGREGPTRQAWRGRTLVVAALLLIGLVGGGLVVFHDQLFGAKTETHDR